MHQHTLTELYLLFLLGAAMHIVKRLSMSKLPSFQYLRIYWKALTVRTFLGYLFFAAWQSNPTAIAKYDPTGILAWIIGALPNTHLTAPLFGYFVDSGLDALAGKIPWLGKEIPPLPENGNGGTAPKSS